MRTWTGNPATVNFGVLLSEMGIKIRPNSELVLEIKGERISEPLISLPPLLSNSTDKWRFPDFFFFETKQNIFSIMGQQSRGLSEENEDHRMQLSAVSSSSK